jgi:hypothetical protein
MPSIKNRGVFRNCKGSNRRRKKRPHSTYGVKYIRESLCIWSRDKSKAKGAALIGQLYTLVQERSKAWSLLQWKLEREYFSAFHE